MKYIVLLIVLVVISSLADAMTDASAFAMANMIDYGSEFSAVKTVCDNHVSTPDLNFKSQGEVTTELKLADKGTYDLTQCVATSSNNYRGLEGWNSFSNSFSGSCLTNVKMAYKGTVATGFSNLMNPYVVETKNLGMSIASPGSEDYIFSLAGEHKTVTNAAIQRAPIWMTEEPKIYSISFEQYPMDLDRPADQFKQNMNLDLKVVNNDVAYYGYDFSRDLTIGDIDCKSDMEFVHQEI